jgi:linoleoyl-CoA desaturase
MVVLPILVLDYSPASIIATYCISGFFVSMIFIVMLVGTHFFDEAAFPAPTPDARLPDSWVHHNLSTSCDWNPSSPFARFISGGANCHAAHHLFPNICHSHYGKLIPIITQETSRFSLPYHSMGITAMVKSHFRLLKRLGRP